MGLVVVVLAGLLVRSYAALTGTERGLDTADLLTFSVTLPPSAYPEDATVPGAFAGLGDALRAVPGVTGVTASTGLPFSGGWMQWDFELEGRPPRQEGDRAWNAGFFFATAGYFETLGIPLVEGRGIVATDGPDAPLVGVVSETMARTYWPGESALGKRWGYARDDGSVPWITVVGVARDPVMRSLAEDPYPFVWIPEAQAGLATYAWPRTLTFALRTGVGAASRNRLGFGCGFADMNLDGALDLVVANGHIDETVRPPRTGVGHAQPPLLLLNQGNGTFADRAAAAGPAFAQPRVARGLAFGDFDNDGDVDVLMTTNNGPAVLFRNDQTAGHRSLRFALQGTTSNRDAIGATVAEDDGGVGTTWVGAAAIVEALAQGSGSLAAIVAAHEALGLAPVLALASAEQRERLLPRLVTGELATGLLGGGIAAVREAGQWCLSGRASDVVGGATASKLVVVAAIDGEPTAFLVEGDAGGVVRKRPALLGLRAAGVADIELASVRVDDDARLGAVGAAADVAALAEDRVRVLFAAIACGLGRAALSSAIVYAKEREQFGQPIAQFQAIQWKLADAATGLDAAALLVHDAAARLDSGRPAAIAAARALVFAGTQAAKAAHDALQVHGGYGYVRDFPVERHLRDARATQVLVSEPAALRTVVADGIAARFE